jgi:hypothetical protein
MPTMFARLGEQTGQLTVMLERIEAMSPHMIPS